MAATIQTPSQQPPPTSNNTSPANPQLKRIVYSKYRELLGSYNDKANAIIESLPAYMVKEDRGFHFDPKIIDEVDKVVYGTPPAPPSLSTGSVPSQRLSTQMPQYNVGEAPACVQNAMMTKDKKPFTYTPGGIDLSQIKSQRMAKRLARNAQNEGATGQQQMNRPTPPPQPQSNGGTPPAAAAQLGASAMGMPFQVFPTGPPPPPPPQPTKGGAPPPPPPAPQNKLAPQANGNAAAHARKSPTPQNFEPPPMGFRPEIKIPPNPMAALKKVPPPQEKNNFWMEEYRKERSKSPMVGNDENDYNRSSPNNPQPETNQYTYNNSPQNEYQPQQNQYRRSPSPQPMRQQPEYYSQRAASPPRTPVQQLDQQRRIESPYQTQYSPQPQPQQQHQPLPSIQRQTSHQYESLYQPPTPTPSTPQQQSPPIQRQQTAPPQQYQGPTSPQYQQQQQQSPPTPQQQQQTVPWRSQRQVASNAIQNNVSRPRDIMSPAPSESSRSQPQQHLQQQQYPAYLRSREVQSPTSEPPQVSQPYQQKNSQVGSIYIPPVATQQQSPSYQDPQGVRQQQSSRQVPANRWVSPPQPSSAESQPLNRIKSPPPPSSNGFGISSNTGLKLQINNNTTNAKERIIPIQLEHTPTPTRTPAGPGIGPQPFYNANQQKYSSVPSPPLAQGTSSNGQNSPSYVVRSPNQFVDQGYNNYPGSQDPNRVTSPTAQQMQSPRIFQQANTAGGVKTRIIPIALESQPDGPLNPNNVRGPISQQPLVIQNDPRNQNAWGSGSATPNQSKSFRILQKITDTTEDGASENRVAESDSSEQEPQLQRPSYARQMGPGQINSPTVEQMKRMQLNNEQAFANRAMQQDGDEEPMVKVANEDPRYRGPSNPSKTFKKLQGAVERCSPSRTANSDGTSPVMKQPQPNRYANQRPVYSQEEQSQQYVHPSEQQVPEPKKYTGSAIPSRSFKILQAMTTPENAAEMEGSDVVESNKPITECPCQQPPPPAPYVYPYPYLQPCCPPPPPPSSLSGGDDINNWQYPLAPHHHPIHHHNHSHHQHHPYAPCPYYYYYPPNEYDSQNCCHCQVRDSLSRGNSQPQDLPNIIITPSAEDIPQVVKSMHLIREQREGSVIEELSRRLSEIAQPIDDDLNMIQENDKKYVGDEGKEVDNSPSPIKSECENNKISSEDSSDDLLTSSTDPTTTSSYEDCAEQINNDGLQSIKSVTNIQIYNKKNLSTMDTFDDDRTVADGESMIFDDDDEEEEEMIGEELEYDEEELLIEEMDSGDEAEVEELDEDEVIVMDDLSVIYEENEADALSPRPASRISSSVSGSTTLANEECEEEDVIKEEVEDDDNSNSVTVRLPLKFSFSRSSNDENIATIEVGNSQVEDKRRSFSVASVAADPEEDDSDSQDCDVSVTISLSPSSGSFDRKSSLSPIPRIVGTIVKEDVKEKDVCDSEAEDVSVSFSLPMRNKFMNQTWCGDVTNNVAKTKTKKKRTQSNEDSAVETWMRNSGVFEGKEEKTKKITQLEASYTIEDTSKNDFWSTSSDVDSKTPKLEKKKTKDTHEGTRRNSRVFEENEDNIVLLKKIPQLEAAYTTEDYSETPIVVNETEDMPVETRRRNSSVFENKEEKTVVLRRTDVSDALVDTEIKKIKIIEDSKDKCEDEKEIVEIQPTKESQLEEQSENNVGEELDFWATLQATRKEAQLFLEKTADYWGKKISAKEKAEVQPENAVIEIENPKEQQTEADFWASIRVRDSADLPKIVEATFEEHEEVATKKEPKAKSAKPKKKKKIIQAPEKEPEPEHVWSTIKRPNANNRAKIVESTIQMIQSKAKRTKELVKQHSKEVEVSDLVASIKETYDKEEKEEMQSEEVEALASAKPASNKMSVEETKKEDIVASISVTKNHKEDIRSSLIREKAELRAQILNQKYANAFVIPEKPVLMRAIVSESEVVSTISSNEYVETSKVGQKWEFSAKVSSPISYETENPNQTSPDVQIVLEEYEKLNKSKKKIAKAKKVVEEDEDGTLKLPKSKSVKKSTKEPKKIKRKKPDPEVQIEEIIVSAATVGETVQKIETEVVEPDFWMDIESSKSNPNEETTKNKATNQDAVANQETDFWATIESSKAKNEEADFWTNIELPKSKKPSVDEEEPDFWAEIGSSRDNKEDNNEREIEEVDISAEIEASKAKNENKPLLDSSKAKIGENVEMRTENADIWAKIEASRDENARRPSASYQEPDFWSEIGAYKTKQEDKYELQIQEVDIWDELETSKVRNSQNVQRDDSWAKTESNYDEMVDSFKVRNPSNCATSNEEPDFWAEIGSSKAQNEVVEFISPKAYQDQDFWSTIDSFKGENKEENIEDTELWSQIEPSVGKSPVQRQEPDLRLEIECSKSEKKNIWSEIESSKEEFDIKTELGAKSQESHEIKLKNKKKSKKPVQEREFGIESDTSRPKTKKKSSTLKESSTEISVETDIGPEIDTPKAKSKKKSSALKEIAFETETSPKTKSKTKKKTLSSPKEELFDEDFGREKHDTKKKSSTPKDEPATTDFWAEIETSKPKTSSKAIKSSCLRVYTDCDLELINLEPVPTYYATNNHPELEVDFWATISYAQEDTLPKSNVYEEKDTDFWASNSSGNETEVNSEIDTGKIDFWVTQRKFETNSGFTRDTTPKNEKETEDVDFWAEIKGSDEDEDDVPAILPKDECEVRRNNYKKAMAFFTNTVNVEKKEESPVPPRNVDASPIYEEEKTPEAKPFNSWVWRQSVEHEWEVPEDQEVNDVYLIVEDNKIEDEPENSIENNPYEIEEVCEFEQIGEEQAEEEEDSSESISDSTPNHFQVEHQYPKPEPEPIRPKEKSIEPISNNKFSEEIKISVKDRIFAFETGAVEPPSTKLKTSLIVDSATPKSNLSRNSSQRSESEIEEDDSGVTDMNKLLSETDTESESFPELRKMTRYQRASTHSRLFKLLQDEGDVIEEELSTEDKTLDAEFNFKPRKKIVHNVSITRKQNPKALQEAETLMQRRERLSLPLHKNSSIDADNLSSPNSPASPIFGQPSQAVSDKLVNELVQSLLLKKSSSTLKNLPMEKLQAAAKRVLEEELDSLENTSLDSTPALTPQEFKSESYSDYYDSWSAKSTDASDTSANGSFEILPSKAFKALQDTTATAKRRPWAVRCPRVLSSKTVNRDLARVTESPEIYRRSSNSPEIIFGSERASSVGRWRKV